VSTVALSARYGAIESIDGAWFARLVTAGARWVSAHREELNRINVFPVVDGDTGTNMAATLRMVARAMSSGAGRPLPAVARAAAEGCLTGARGNSGMILCHIFTSLAAGIGVREAVSPAELVAILRAAATDLERALETPVEGTILTVLRESTAAPVLDRSRDMDELTAILCREARASLARTPEKLEVLARAKVVDSGALGYVYFLEGMLRELRGQPLPDLGEEVAVTTARAHVTEEVLAYRYCTEVVIEPQSPLTTGRLKLLFRSHGDSLIPLLTGRMAKVHVHTNDPQQVFAVAAQVGRVVKTKVEDMRTQTHGMLADDARSGGENGSAAAVRTRIVTDSTCDLPSEVLSQWGVQVVPLKVAFGDESMRDRIDILPDEFLHRLTTSPVHPQTSQPSPEDFSRALRRLAPVPAGRDGEILVMVLSSKLSGTHASARMAIDRLSAGAGGASRVHLFDAAFASAPFGLLVLRAAELARKGLAAREIVLELERVRDRTNILFVLDTLEYMKRGGRISWGKAFLGSLLDLKPILEFKEGRMVPRAKARGRSRARDTVLDLLAADVPRDRPVRFMLVHSGRPDLLAPVEQFLTRTFQVSSLLTCAAGAVISTHTGPGAWGVAWMVE
jgi:DegV family protein with EDD domain